MTDIFSAPAEAACNGVHLMVDLETLGTTERAPIISIGAVLFDPNGADTFASLHAKSFLRLIDIEDAINTCGPAEGGTIKWWFSQSDAAIKRLISEDCIFIKEALGDLWQYSHARVQQQPSWLNKLPIPTHIWAKDPDFDCKILTHACKQTKVSFPFHFAFARSVRTAQDLAFPNGELPTFSDGRGEHEIVHHDARDDAVMQALMIQACYRELGMAREQATFHKY